MSQGKNTIFAKQKLLKKSLHNSYKTREPIIGPTQVSKRLGVPSKAQRKRV